MEDTTVSLVNKSASSSVIDVNERTFRAEVLERSRTVPVVVDFWAPWCGPCRMLGPILERLATEAKGAWILAKLNVDENPRLAQMFQVQSIPAVKAFRDGRVVDEFTGALPESQVRAWLKRIMPPPPASPADRLAEEAAAIEDRDPLGAKARYESALSLDPNHSASLFGLGRLMLVAGDPAGAEMLKKVPSNAPQAKQAQAWLTLAELIAEAEETNPSTLLERIEQNPADLEARWLLAAHQLRGQRYADAIQTLLAIVMRNRAFRDDGARKMLLALFTALGDQHPLTVQGRRDLANAMF
jgi:putative thioredoxin